MPENARTPVGWGVLALVLGFPLQTAGSIASIAGVLLQVVGMLLVGVGAIAWGVWLALDQRDRDLGRARATSRIDLADDHG